MMGGLKYGELSPLSGWVGEFKPSIRFSYGNGCSTLNSTLFDILKSEPELLDKPPKLDGTPIPGMGPKPSKMSTSADMVAGVSGTVCSMGLARVGRTS